MKFGFVLPRGDGPTAVAVATAVEQAGWDGFFMWEPVWGVDPWVALGAVAMRTERVRLGTLLTPPSRRRPWKLAGETATLDHLSQGRVILSVGLGAPDTGFANFGEATDRHTRAELLDESLDILYGLWRGQPFNYQGKHYQITETTFLPPAPPVQQPHIPIWVVGLWPRQKSMQRALRCDGLLAATLSPEGQFRPPTPAEIGQMKAFVQGHRRADTPFDIVVEGVTPGDDPTQAAAQIRPYAAAGATWWIESLWETPDLTDVLRRVRQGPPPGFENRCND